MKTLIEKINVLYNDDEDLNIQALSYETGMDESLIVEILRGIRKPSVEELETLLNGFGCHLDIINNYTGKIPRCLGPKPKHKVVLVIGNGFDMDLGLQTSYRKYCESEEWPFNTYNFKDTKTGEMLYSPLAEFIDKNKADNKYWFGLESMMRDYCIQVYSEYKDDYKFSRGDKLAYDILCKSLRKYLKECFESFLKDKNAIEKARNSEAYSVLKRLFRSNSDFIIHSFNYTDTEKLAYYLEDEHPSLEGLYEWSSPDRPFLQTHGTIYSKSIVLGVDEGCPMPRSLSFLKKTHNPGFVSSLILQDLKNADEVIFFGHSMGEIDCCYFKDFIRKQSVYEPEKQIKITFYTYDENASHSIIEKMARMNDDHIMELRGNSGLEFYYTKKD